jgi:Xaa-Pro aminopeptidase
MLRSLFEQINADCLIVTSVSNTTYYSGYNNPECTIVATKDGVTYYTDDRYTGEAKSIIPADWQLVSCHCTNFKRIGEDIVASGAKKVACEMGYLTHSSFESLRSFIPGAEFVDCTALLCDGRMVKREDELALIRRAAHCNDVAFENLLGQVKEGMTELELGFLLQYEYIKAGGEGIAFDTISVFGEHTAYPHGHPGHQKLQKGDVITLDFGCKVGGYCSDITRSFAFGDPGEEYKIAYQHVLTANLKGIEAGHIGVTGQELDKISRDYLDSVGLGKYFSHSLGHGVGLDIHEKPFLNARSTDKIMKGMTYTIEPGIYINGKFGIRIEDLLVMGDQPELLSRCNKNLIIL